MSHSRLSPSAAGQWVHCPGSVPMRARFPETGRSESAEDGTAAHWVGSEVLCGRGADPFEGRIAPNKVVITMEMVDAARTYVGHVRSIAAPGNILNVERRTAASRIHPDCFGTPDAWHFNPGTRELHVWDLKYGFGIVEPFENWQLICYAIGALDSMAYGDMGITVHLHIVQPRASHRLGPIRTWSVQGDALRGYGNKLETAAVAALSADPQCVSGSHCAYCRALHACPSAQGAALRAVDISGAATPDLLDNASAAFEYRILLEAQRAIKHRLSAREGQLIAALNAGEPVPGLALEHGTGHAGWDRPVEELFALGDIMGVDLRSEPKAITPAQAKAKGLDAGIVAAYSSKKSTGYKLVSATATIAATVFGGK